MIFGKKNKKKVQTITVTDENFREVVLNTDKGVLLDFWAPWCGPCKIIGPIIDEIAEEFGDKAVIGKVNVDQNPKLSNHFKIKSIPTLVFIKDQQMLEKFSGMIPKPNLKDMVNDLINFKVLPKE